MKKSILLVVFLVVIMASFVACKNEEPVASEPASSSEEVSEPASEEMSSEEVSEELPSEDVVVEDAYSAEAIMKLVEDLTVKYPYNNPEHIKALVIAIFIVLHIHNYIALASLHQRVAQYYYYFYSSLNQLK